MIVVLLYRYTINKTNLVDLEGLYEQYVLSEKYLDDEMVFTIDLPDNCRIKGTYKGDDFREIIASGSKLDKCSRYNYRAGKDHDEYTNKLIKDEIVDNIIEDLSPDVTASVKDNILEQGEDTITFLGNYIEQIDSDLDKNKLKEVMKDLYTEASER